MGWIKNLKKAGDCESCDCPPAVCDACCPAPVLVCETRSASKSKVGFAEYVPSTPPKRYLVKTQVYSFTGDGVMESGPDPGAIHSSCCGGSPPGCSATEDGCPADPYFSDTGTITQTYDPATGALSSSGSIVQTDNNTALAPFFWSGCASPRSAICSFSPTISQTATVYSRTGSCTRSTPIFGTCPPTLSNCNVCSSQSALSDVTTLSSEDTTAAMIARAEAALPAWPGTWLGSSCTAFRNLSSDESSYTIREARFKFKLPTGASLPAGQKLSISYQTSFAPEGGGSPTVDNYTIEITGTESSIITIAVPATDGTTSLTMTGYECVPV